MANTYKFSGPITFGTFPIGYATRHWCSKCHQEITLNNAIEVSTARGGYFGYGVLSHEDDDEGIEWRTFCSDCYDEVSNQDPETVYNQFEAGEYEIE